MFGSIGQQSAARALLVLWIIALECMPSIAPPLYCLYYFFAECKRFILHFLRCSKTKLDKKSKKPILFKIVEGYWRIFCVFYILCK